MSRSLGARAANSGNEFHFRFAARRSLALLDPASGLSFVRIENGELPASDAEFVGVDISEYYGGDSIAEALRVRSMQLKYSVVSNRRPWTLARITTTTKKGGASVIGRLATDFTDYVRASSRETVLAKLSIELVSNDSVGEELQGALTRAQSILQQSPAPSSLLELTYLVSEEDRHAIDALFRASGLDESQFCDFLRVLDFSGCGQPALEAQDLLLIQEASEMLGDAPGGAIRTLVDYVRNLALPNRSEHRGLTKTDVIACLGAISEDSLLPARSLITTPANPIETGDQQRILESVVAGDAHKILFHGPPGVGKTTSLALALQNLPEGCEFVLFDCWANGQSFEVGGARHTVHRALKQVLNELSFRIGLPPLVSHISDPTDLETRLRKRVKLIAQELDRRGALLVIAIDAADNAVMAANERSETCFVPWLWRWTLPHNCRLVMTARTHRRELLQATDDAVSILLSGFDVAMSGAHLRMSFPEANQLECESFHSVTQGNPRLQAYKLEAASKKGSLETALDPKISSIEHLFDAYVRASFTEVGVRDDPKNLLASFICMSRPVALDDFAKVNEITKAKAWDYLNCLVPGVILNSEIASVKDENFDDFLRSRVTQSELEQAHGRIADRILDGSLPPDYAGRAIAEHLAGAGRWLDLIDLALTGRLLDNIQDAVLRAQLVRRRLQRALDAARRIGRATDASKLILLLGMNTKSETAFADVVKEDPELASRFGDPNAVGEILLSSKSEPWLGPAHCRIAAWCAREGLTEAATSHLQNGQAWLRRYLAMSPSDRHDWRLEFEDLAAAAEAIYWMHGLDASIRYTLGWRPSEEIGARLMDRLCSRVDPLKLAEELQQLKRPSWLDFHLTSSMWRRGCTPTHEVIEAGRSAARRTRAKNVAREKRWDAKYIDYCEARVAAGLDSTTTLDMLAKLSPSLPRDLERDVTFLFRQHEEPLRAICLRAALAGVALNIRDLLPPELKESAKSNYTIDQERSRYLEILQYLAPAYELRAKLICHPELADQASIEEEVDRVAGTNRDRWGRKSHRYESAAQQVIDVVLKYAANPVPLLRRLAEAAWEALGAPAFKFNVDLAIACSYSKQSRLATEILESLDQRTEPRKMPGNEKRDLYLILARAASLVDIELARDFYQSAIRASEGVDIDSMAILDCVARSCREVSSRQTLKDHRKEIALRLARLVELHEPFAPERKYLPVYQVTREIAHLWPTGSLVVAARWESADFFDLSDSLPIVSEVLVNVGTLAPRFGLALLKLCGSSQYLSSIGIDLVRRAPIEESELEDLAQDLVNTILRDVKLGDRRECLQELVFFANEKGISELECIRKAVTTLEFLGTLKHRDGEISGTYRASQGNDLESLVQRITSKEGWDRHACLIECTSIYYDEDLTALARAIDRSTKYGERKQTLEEFVGLDASRIRIQSAGRLLLELLRLWCKSGRQDQVTSAAPSIVAKFVQRQALEFYYFEPTGWHLLAELLHYVRNPDLALEACSAAVLERPDSIGLHGLCGLAHFLWSTLDDASWLEVYHWAVSQMDLHLNESSSTYSVADFGVSDDPVDAFTGLIWSVMGHPQRGMRWNACHAARFAAASQPQRLIQSLVSRTTCVDAKPFQTSQRTFFWLSARVSLLVVLQRLADEFPGEFANQTDPIAKIALSKELPHAQLREIAKQCLLTLGEKGHIEPTVLVEVELANAPKACFTERKSAYQSRYGRREPEGVAFGFDTMDTIPYWFEPADRVFGHPRRGALERADKWISSTLRLGEEDESRSRKYGYDDTGNRHGSMPRVEDEQHYLEFHSLMLAMGEMADEGLPMLIDTYDEPEDPWKDFLGPHLPFSWKCWLSDRVAATPLEPEAWGELPNEDRWRDKSDVDFRRAVGLTTTVPQFISVFGSLEASDWRRSSSTSIHSALVSPKTARSLAIGIVTSSRHDFVLPTEGTHSDAPIRSGSFALDPFVRYLREREGLDEFDPRVGKFFSIERSLSSDPIARLELTLDGRTGALLDSQGLICSFVEGWDNHDRRSRDDRWGTSGSRLWISLDSALQVMRIAKRDLVIVVEILRNYHSDSYGSEKDERDHGSRQVFIIRRNGTIEAL